MDIDDYVTTLSVEERSRFKDLIDETRARERQIREGASRALVALDDLAATQRQLHRELGHLVRVSERARDAVTSACFRSLNWGKLPVN